jgi:hypothetical protein
MSCRGNEECIFGKNGICVMDDDDIGIGECFYDFEDEIYEDEIEELPLEEELPIPQLPKDLVNYILEMRRKSMLKDYRRNKKTLSEQHLLDLYDDKKRVYDVKKKTSTSKNII